MTTDPTELAFQTWQTKHEAYLLNQYPATVGDNGAANNFSYWCRQVYTGRIKLERELE